MHNKRSQLVAAFLIFPGLWNVLLPSSSTPLPTSPRGGEEVRPVLPLADEREPTRTIWVLATAYTSSVDETDDTPFITASGTITHPGTVAANFLTFNRRMRMPSHFGDFVFTIEDRMNERYGQGRIDIWMPNKAMAREWGARWVKVELY